MDHVAEFRVLTIAALVVTRLAGGAGAQTNTAEIAGVVHDAQGARLAGATVSVEHVGGRRQMEFRWDIYNTLNRANFDLPSRIFGTPNFGRIFSAKSAREMQLGVRFML